MRTTYRRYKNKRKNINRRDIVMDEQAMKRKLFKYLQEERADQDILRCKDKETNKEMILSVSSAGVLYDKKGVGIPKSKMKRYWHALYFYALSNAYSIVPEGFMHET